MELLNKNQISLVKVQGFKKLNRIKYIKESLFFGLYKKEGYFYLDHFMTKEEIKANDLVEFEHKKGLWEKPVVKIYLAGDISRYKYFESEQEMEKWIEKELKGLENLIEL